MTLPEILGNEELRQHEFPIAKDTVYLAHAGVCPLPRRVAEAVTHYAQRCVGGDQETVLPEEFFGHTRQLAARLVGATPEEIALVGPTSLGLSFVAAGLDWRPGDNLLVYFDDYPTNVYPWMKLADRGVEVRRLQTQELGLITPETVLSQVDERTRLVALASCHFVAGYRIDFRTIGRRLRERGILFCLDAIQTLGAFPMDVEHVDFLAADAHKWMLGPCSAGLLFVRRDLQEQLAPTTFGWHNVRCPNFTAQEQLTLRPDARRYECGTANLLGLAGMRAAIELLLELGLDTIGAELLRKRAWLVGELTGRGWTVLHAEASPDHASGITTFHRPGADMEALHRRLLEARMVTSLRADRAGRKYLRLSPHFYNSEAELQRVLNLLE